MKKGKREPHFANRHHIFQCMQIFMQIFSPRLLRPCRKSQANTGQTFSNGPRHCLMIIFYYFGKQVFQTDYIHY